MVCQPFAHVNSDQQSGSSSTGAPPCMVHLREKYSRKQASEEATDLVLRGCAGVYIGAIGHVH